MADKDAAYWVKALDLGAHPEGGWFRETYRSVDRVAAGEAAWSGSGSGSGGERAASTAIYYLLEGAQFSAFHRIRSDEAWHFYAGSSLILHELHESGTLVETRLGGDPEFGESFQAVVPAGRWFAATVANPRGFALVGCTVAPGFDFRDFELASRDELIARFPQHADVIRRLTR